MLVISGGSTKCQNEKNAEQTLEYQGFHLAGEGQRALREQNKISPVKRVYPQPEADGNVSLEELWVVA
jgi:hypothetical protein